MWISKSAANLMINGETGGTGGTGGTGRGGVA